MVGLPSGTVTFLFTDIDGSTTLWERDRQAMAAAVARQLAILQNLITAHHGVLFKTIGDGTQAAFASAEEALRAAVASQRALLAEDWADAPGPLRVRMALHAGEAIPDAHGDYLAAPLNRLSRLLSTGYGGQILLAQTVQQLTRGALPAGTTLQDLGEHRLRDLLEPEHVFQLVHPDLPADFPPLRSLDARPQNLPRQPTPFLGREQQVADVVDLLRRDDTQLLTLVGPGGTGKTRLALQVAAEVLEDFADGVFFVPLASLADPAFIPSAIAAALGLREEGEQSLAGRLHDFLATRDLLLVLDNFEHLVEGGSAVWSLLGSAPRVTVLATSRVPLHLRAEREYPVPPLGLPRRTPPPTLEQLSQYEAVRLFIDRAQAVKPDFAVDNENAPAVAEICWRLDGLPLAIELAAARVRLLPPQAMLGRLEQRLPFLTGGARDAPERQRTLRNTIAWSFDLLTPEDQILFRRLAAFSGGCTLEAAEAVGNHDGALDAFNGVERLCEQSLLRQAAGADGAPRFTMLETIREFGLERLVAAGEEPAIRTSLVAYFLAFVQAAEPELKGPNQLTWIERLETEHANLRAALGWALEHDAATALRLAGALWWFWRYRSHFTEGRSWLERALAASPIGLTRERAKALHGAGALARHQGDVGRAAVLLNEALVRYRESGDEHGVAASLGSVGALALEQGDLERGERLFEEALMIWRGLEDKRGVNASLNSLGLLAMDRGDLDLAARLFDEALSSYRAMGAEWEIALMLHNLGEVAYERGDLDLASAHQEEALASWEGMEDTHGVAYVLDIQGKVAWARGELDLAMQLLGKALVLWRELGDQRNASASLLNLGRMIGSTDHGRAAMLLQEALVLSREAGYPRVVASLLEGVAGTALGSTPERAARLLGAAAAMREALGIPVPASEREDHDRTVAATRAALSEAAFAAASTAGRALPVEEAVNEALALVNALVRDADQVRLLRSAGETP